MVDRITFLGAVGVLLVFAPVFTRGKQSYFYSNIIGVLLVILYSVLIHNTIFLFFAFRFLIPFIYGLYASRKELEASVYIELGDRDG